ncbi:Protein kinase [uncultured virus]|nr:Protein kinase [uncultured virus]
MEAYVIGQGVHGIVSLHGTKAIKTSNNLYRSVGEIFVTTRLSHHSQYLIEALSYKLAPNICKLTMRLGIPLMNIIESLTIDERKKIVNMITIGLADLEDLGIIHGDIKVENIIILDGFPKIIDFGIVTGKTQTNDVITQTYQSPSLKRDYRCRALYALGVTAGKILNTDTFEFPWTFTESLTTQHPDFSEFFADTLGVRPPGKRFRDLLPNVIRKTSRDKLFPKLSSIEFFGPYLYAYGAEHRISSSIIFDAVTRMSHFQTIMKIPIHRKPLYAIACLILSASLRGDNLSIPDEIIDYEILKIIIDHTYPYQLNEQITTVDLILYCYRNEYHHASWRIRTEKFRQVHGIDETNTDVRMITVINNVFQEINIKAALGIYIDDEKKKDYFLDLEKKPLMNPVTRSQIAMPPVIN